VGSRRHLRRTVAALAAAAVVLAAAAGSSAAHTQTGTLVVRLVTDPAPPGAGWTYSGAGAAFSLDGSPGERSVSLPPGTYRLAEAAAAPGQPASLTALTCTDPDRNTTTSLASATASVGLEDGETVVCTFTHRALGPRGAAAVLAQARAYAPVLRLAATEPYRPLRLEDYLSLTALHAGSPPHGAVLEPRPTLFSLAAAPASSYLDVGGAQPNGHPSVYRQLEQGLEATRPRPTVYWHAARRPTAGRIAIEYWLLYLYNDFYDRHEADWEGVTVVLQDGRPLGASFSAHQGRRWVAWSALTTDGTHPVAYVARGSHAVYASPGRYGIRVCWKLLGGRRCAPTPRIDAATGTGATLAPAGYDLEQLGGAPYAGTWGSGTYVLGIGLTRDRVTDPRRRSDYSFPFGVVPGGVSP
jgi:hypothetical protein